MALADSLISVRGARTHNLKNIDVDLPRDQLIVITGLSGSGKSSLAFDTLYAEGQRRYVESLSAYARQFLSMMEKPDVDLIEGLSPAISIEQKSTSHNPRSTVGTITEVYDYLRLLFARVGEPRCPTHNTTLAAQTVSEMVDAVMKHPEGSRLMILSPLVSDRKGEHRQVFQELIRDGFIRAWIDGQVWDLDDPPTLDKNKKHSILAVVDRIVLRGDSQQRLAESFETALNLSDGTAVVKSMDDDAIDEVFSSRFACAHCGYSISELEPRMFSFNNPAGACSACDGLGTVQRFDPRLLVTDPSLSLADGAITGISTTRNPWYFRQIKVLADHLGFTTATPYQKLKKRHRDIVLYGLPHSAYTKSSRNPKPLPRRFRWDGVISNLERRYRDTSSQHVRDHLHRYMSRDACPQCNGTRLREESRHIFIGTAGIADITATSIDAALKHFRDLRLEGRRGEIADKILKEIRDRLQFLVDVGLNYLTLERSAETLSGGEAQRIRLASQIGSGLVGVMYILDEPSIGLHQRDNARLLKTLSHLRDLGNTVMIVEHDEEAIRKADHIIDIGPGAGIHGGEIVAQGSIDRIMANRRSLTGQYLCGAKSIAIPSTRTPFDPQKTISIGSAHGNNLQHITVDIPIGLLTCVTGVSGSGKSTLINHTLYPIAARELNRATSATSQPLDSISGLGNLDKVVEIDQSPIGRTPRSNPATYTGLFTPIRDLFSQTQESRSRGYKPGRFSFNVKGGRCEACQGDGLIKVEMHFLPDIYVTCDTCKGQRYNRETLEVRYKDKNIHQILNMTVEEAFDFFNAIPVLKNKLQTLIDVGLSYIKLGQSATTLSGGEAQRIKLSRELSKRATGSTLYILDEPTTGLHFHDIQLLLNVLHRLRDQGNTVVVIEHNLDVIKTADWIVDLGPEGGAGGGKVVAAGTPEDIAALPYSFTGQFLAHLFDSAELELTATAS